MDTIISTNLRHVDPAEVDGPDPEVYREMAEEHTRPYQAPACLGHSDRWACARCGGPNTCPDLESTLPYVQCGYAEVAGGLWVHQ